MPAIIEGLEYDLFISYRQNDNQYDGWVTEFVTKLRQELEATVKDRLSVFFDENPEDGLLETHQVDHSISPKIKCLIFIPIISQTYCDTSSFAWNNEFLAFKEASKVDKLGPMVDLPNGNVASRILPVKIHDIDLEDVRLLEQELEGALRSIDFIYQSAGVNRPLRPKDDDLMDNANRTNYRNQINKVANAIKEIVQGAKGIRRKPSPQETSSTSITSGPGTTTEEYSVTVPDGITVSVISKSKPTVYLAWTSKDLKDQREEMGLILQKAGFFVLPSIDCPADDEEFKRRVSEDLSKSDCALHMLSGEYGRRFEEDEDLSFPRHQFEEAMKLSAQEGSQFQTFIWFNPDPAKPVKDTQASFVNFVRNNITRNMMFSNSLGPMQLVDDIRALMMKEEDKALETKDTDIFFIFNQQDASEAQEITDQIGVEYPIETMNILPDGEEEYRELSTQQIPKSKLAVVYFKYAADWALPFIKQVWKQIGGASSPTPILLVGEDEPKTNMARTFKAPKVVSTIVPKDVVSEEIKKVYVKVIELR